ncbi:hypothetical protein DSO57_1018273 [Entomophthora muscae]|uniref:Uncharacterized protein n=1 Tax=Entomophthora muscae TaxID=34485 RepID=A0ACC2STC3_9FUNG|nr:hypothetical protein DSO57_1018273 [Entomophthora muscae]
MEQNLLSDVVDRIGKWKYKKMDLASKAQALNTFVYSKIWYIAHILPFSEKFEKKLDKLTRAFIWGNPQAAPIALDQVTRLAKEGGIGLLPTVASAHCIWGKSFLACMESNLRLPALGRALNWADAIQQSNHLHTNSLREYLANQSELCGRMGAPIYWKLSMRALRLGGWKFHKSPSNTAHPLHNEFIQNRMWASCTNNNARASLALMITNKITSNTYATVSKWKPKPQYPQIMKGWMEEGVDISMRPKDIVNGMNCKLVPIKV